MSIFIYKPKFRVRYIGKSPNLTYGYNYIIESNLISNGILLLKLELTEGLYPSNDFEGEVFNIQKPSLKDLL